MKKIYVIGIGGIGISGIARYYNENGFSVYGSDKTDSELIKKLQSEGINIIIGEDNSRIDETFEKVIYTEAVPKTQSELKKSLELNLKVQTYPESLAQIANEKKLIAISGTHGKSTTTSLVSIMMKKSNLGINSLVGSLLKEFDGKNTYFSQSEYFCLEACEYKRSFLRYKPYIGVITNIEIDHLDYYKDLDDYISAFRDFGNNIVKGGYLILDKNCSNSMKLYNLREDINYILIDKDKFIFNSKEIIFQELNIKIPGEHILFDAKIAYVVGYILGLEESEIINSLEEYNGIWRRSETVGKTLNNNILMSDYGHHPTEIILNLKALKNKYSDKKIITIFQPHQYNRTLELLEDFKNAFWDTDILIIPDIYESRDTQEDKAKIDGKKLTNYINHSEKYFGDGMKNTLKMINNLDTKFPGECIFILQGAGNVDDLRYEINLK